MLQCSHESYPHCAVPIPSSFLNPSTEATPSQMDAEMHNISDNSEPSQEHEGAADSGPPSFPQIQNSERVSPESRSVLEKNATEIPLKAIEQSARDVSENVPASSANPASGAVPSVQSSPRGYTP